MRRSSLGWPVLPLLSFLAFGCEKGSGDSTSPTGSAIAAVAASAADGATVAPSASSHRAAPFGRHGGLAAGLFRAARDLNLNDTQKEALDKIEATLKDDDDEVRAAMKTFRGHLVAGVKAAALDSATLAADNALIDQAIADHQAKEARALDSLHTLLDSGQRASLVAAVRARQAERELRMARWMPGAADGGAHDWTQKRIARWSADLDLEADQQKALTAIFAKAKDVPNEAGMKSRWDDARKREDALVAAFSADAFDAKTADLTIMPGKTAHEPMTHMVAFFSQLLPILHPIQRDKVANELNKPFGFGGAPRMRDGGMPARGPADDFAFPFEELTDSPPGEPGPTR
jgi:Spy/CpxP family protein refolding chaperone